jgi:hypothetical protein
MTGQATSWIDRNAARIAMLAIGGTCLCFVAFGYLLVQNGARASEGAKARDRQQHVYPISVKFVEWAATHPDSKITRGDVACFKDTKKCPAPKPTP